MAMAGTNLPWPKGLPGSGPSGMVVAVRAAGGVAELRWTPRVHVAAVVVADVEHVVVALEHAGQAAEADVGGAAVAALGDDADIAALAFLLLDLDRRGDAGGDRRGVAEQRMDPRNLPGGFRVGRGEDFEAAGGVGRDQLSLAGDHRGVDGVARAERLAAALAGAVPGVERVGALHVGLHRALFGRQQAVADGEGAGLVELDGLK
jgi:hypothetical protein